jgi:hypothetical protein
MKRAYPLLLALLFPALPATAQTGAEGEAARVCAAPLRLAPATLTDAHGDYLRAAELAGGIPLRPHLIRRLSEERRAAACAEGAAAARLGGSSLELLPMASSIYYNSAYPRDRNNGALWEGRGLSTEIRGGIELRWGPLSAALAPTIAYQQNRDFEIVTGTAHPVYSPYIYQGRPRSIDWPQRFGDQPFWTRDAGQSYVRLDAFHLAVGLSNENLWWGPARRNPLLMSSTAPGFPHLFLGTSGGVDVGIGRVEGQMLWGRLEESDYFDNDPANDHNLIAGVVVDFEPRWTPGLYLGAARSYLRHLPAGGLPLSTWLFSPYRGVRENPLGKDNPESDNQLLSLFARWAPPRASFEAYVEWAREDQWADLDELIMVPDASQAFTVGFQKVLPRGEQWVRIAGELTQLADPLPNIRRGTVAFYSHSQLRQGYTHRGRLLGAAIGPGSNAQFLGVDLFTPSGVRGLYVERVRFDADANGGRWAQLYAGYGADVELSAGIHQHLFLRRFDLGWALVHSYRRNRNYLGLYRSTPEFVTEHNWNLRFDLAWRPGARAQSVAPRSAPPISEGRR